MGISEVMKYIHSKLSLPQESPVGELPVGFSSVNGRATINQPLIRLQDTLWQNFAGK